MTTSRKRVTRAGCQSSMKIDELPESLLVEVLARLAPSKLIFQCKSVSKRWLNLISTPYFIGRYLRLQYDLQTPTPTTLVFFDIYRPSNIFLTSENPYFKTISRNFCLSFLPCYENLEDLKRLASQSLMWPFDGESCCLVPPVVVDTYKDLVLCCATIYDQRDYFICNPFTKKWAALPPTPKVYPNVSVSLVVCEPYYFSSTLKGEHASQMIIPVNAQYSWKVVRLVATSVDHKFSVEIFSSETRAWTELVVIGSWLFEDFWGLPSSAVFYNGMLYWCLSDDFIMELNLDHLDTSMSTGTRSVAKCRFIQLPKDLIVLHAIPHLVVNGGRLHFCRTLVGVDGNHGIDEAPDLPTFRVWELKQVVKQGSKIQVVS